MMSLVWSFFLEEQPVLVSQKLRDVSLEREKKTPLVSLCVYFGLPVQVENMLLFQPWWWDLLVCLFLSDSPNSAIKLRKLELNYYKLYHKLAWNSNKTLFLGLHFVKQKSIKNNSQKDFLLVYTFVHILLLHIMNTNKLNQQGLFHKLILRRANTKSQLSKGGLDKTDTSNPETVTTRGFSLVDKQRSFTSSLVHPLYTCWKR